MANKQIKNTLGRKYFYLVFLIFKGGTKNRKQKYQQRYKKGQII